MYYTILDDVTFICKYRYEGDNEWNYIEGGSIDYLKRKMCECTDNGSSVYYKIYAVVEEGHEDPVEF